MFRNVRGTGQAAEGREGVDWSLGRRVPLPTAAECQPSTENFYPLFMTSEKPNCDRDN